MLAIKLYASNHKFVHVIRTCNPVPISLRCAGRGLKMLRLYKNWNTLIGMPQSYPWYLYHVPWLHEWAEKKVVWYTLFAHAQFPEDFLEFGSFHKICSITLTSAMYANFSQVKDACYWLHSVWTMSMKRWRQSTLYLQELSMHLSISAKCYDTWLTQSFP